MPNDVPQNGATPPFMHHAIREQDDDDVLLRILRADGPEPPEGEPVLLIASPVDLARG